MRTLPEGSSDIAAQLAALVDPQHPKSVVFVSHGNEDAIPDALPAGVLRVDHDKGHFFVVDARLAEGLAALPAIDDYDMAALLDLPQAKADALAAMPVVMVQARDQGDRIVTEAVVSLSVLDRAIAHLSRHGRIAVLSPHDALRRRLAARKE